MLQAQCRGRFYNISKIFRKSALIYADLSVASTLFTGVSYVLNEGYDGRGEMSKVSFFLNTFYTKISRAKLYPNQPFVASPFIAFIDDLECNE